MTALGARVPWSSRVPLVVAFLAVAGGGVLIGRASNHPPDVTSAVGAPGASSAPTPPQPQTFDLTENPHAHAGVPLRPMDRDIFAEITALKLERAQMKDVFPDKPYRVVFVGSVSERRIGAVMVDLDRDGKFAERWELKPGNVSRIVLHDPSANGTEVKYTLAHGRWQVH